jgi:soluble lytic murein transglycosylase-like protein
LPKQLEPYRADIMDASKATGVPPSILAGQIWAESRGQLGQDTTNVNGKTDAGLMQVNADTFAGLKKENPELLGNADVNNAHDNIMAGALYMRDQHKAFGDWGSALRAYNSGPDKVSSNLSDAGGVGDPKYVDNVMNFAKIIESGQGQLPA